MATESSFSGLSLAVAACDEAIEPSYARADRLAVRQRRLYRNLVFVAVSCGTLAILMGILKSSGLFSALWTTTSQIAATAVAALSVAFGVLSAFQRRWLLERHRAQQLQSLRFQTLADPAAWPTNEREAAALIAKLRRQVEQIEDADQEELERFASEEELEDETSVRSVSTAAARSSAAQELFELYQSQRLAGQISYSEERSQQYARISLWTKRLPRMLFYASVLAMFGRFSVDLAAGATGPTLASKLLFLVSATLPPIGAGIRSFRTAFDFTRNSRRFRALRAALAQLERRLGAQADMPAVASCVLACEQVLQTEHREWLRLMMDADMQG